MGRVPARHFTAGDVRLGYVSGVFGVRGDVRLFLYNPTGETLPGLERITLVAADGTRTVRSIRVWRGPGRRILGAVEGCSSPGDANALVGTELVASVDALPELDEEEYYHRDLLGTRVVTDEGTDVGRLAEIYSTGEVDTWLVRGPAGERYLPALRSHVLRIRAGDVIVIAADAGVVEDAPKSGG